MPDQISLVHPGQPISAAHYNRLVREIRRLQNISGAGTVSVQQTACGIQISGTAPLRPPNRPFQVAYDTPQDQGYVVALPLTWGNVFIADGSRPTFQVYDFARTISDSSPSASWAPKGGTAQNFTNYGQLGTRLKSNWTKVGFLGDARWEPMSGVWVIEWVEHVARWINFSYGGSNQTYSFGQVDSNMSVTSSWHGLDPTKTSFNVSGQSKTNQIAILNAPNNGFTVKSGDRGTAFWRDDLDNSQAWQYQMIDGGRCSGT